MRFRVRRVEHDEEVTVVEHLDELRNRLLVSLLCLGVAFSVAFWRHEDIVRLLIRQVPKTTDGGRSTWSCWPSASSSRSPSRSRSGLP